MQPQAQRATNRDHFLRRNFNAPQRMVLSLMDRMSLYYQCKAARIMSRFFDLLPDPKAFPCEPLKSRKSAPEPPPLRLSPPPSQPHP